MSFSTITPVRTNGDGMENPDNLEEITTLLLTNKVGHLSLGEKLIYRPQEIVDLTQPTIPLGEMVHLVPKNVKSSSNSKDSVFKNMKSREPKFVPYEPYKAAVNPIVPVSPVKREKIRKKCTKVTDSSRAGVSPLPSIDCASSISSECKDDVALIDGGKQPWIAELEDLKIKNAEIEKQLKFQAQVNCELKSMLVAAVGEDVEVRVQHLTEDKLHLARALLNSSDNLSSHQEQLEWLAGQCEVWRSKFLASSLMLDELARWKTALCQRNSQLQETMQHLLNERSSVREETMKTFRTLQVLRENFDPASGMNLATTPHRRSSSSGNPNLLASSNIVDVASANLRLTESLSQRLLGISAPGMLARDSQYIETLDSKTKAEKRAHQLLESSAADLLGRQPDVACSAVVGAAAAAGCGLFPHISSTPTTCCAHCSGDMKVL